jgi:hypothetical protein
MPPLVWLVYAQFAIGMPRKGSARVKDMNVGRKL